MYKKKYIKYKLKYINLINQYGGVIKYIYMLEEPTNLIKNPVNNEDYVLDSESKQIFLIKGEIVDVLEIQIDSTSNITFGRIKKLGFSGWINMVYLHSIHPTQESSKFTALSDTLSNFIHSNSELVKYDIQNDRTYYYSNQDYTYINESIIELDPKNDDISNYIALFIGEGNIFNLLLTLSNYVSHVIIIDIDDKLIDYKRNELKAYFEATTIDKFYSLMLKYISTIYTDYLKMDESIAIMTAKMAFRIPALNIDSFRNIKDAIMKVKISFLQINIMDSDKIIELGNAIKNSGKIITFVNRTNLMEYGTPHMQIKFFKKIKPKFQNIIDNFKFLPIDWENAVILFGISLQHNEKTFVVKGWENSIKLEQQLIEKNKHYHL
jgi:hypothetical protein